MSQDLPPSYEEILQEEKTKAINRVNQELRNNSLTQQEFIEINDRIAKVSSNQDMPWYCNWLNNWQGNIQESTSLNQIQEILGKITESIPGIASVKSSDREVESAKKESEQAKNERNRLERESEKIRRQNQQWERERDEWWEKYRKGEHDWQTNNQKWWDDYKSEKERKTRQEKEDWINSIKRKLRKKKISEEKLNQDLGVDDWKNEINKQDYLGIISKGYELERIIGELSRTHICDYCKKEKHEYVWYDIPNREEKFCSYECQRDFKKTNNIKDNSNPLRKMTKEEIYGSIIVISLIIALIIRSVRRKKTPTNSFQSI